VDGFRANTPLSTGNYANGQTVLLLNPSRKLCTLAVMRKYATTAPARVSVAVLDFQANLPGNKDLGSQIADILTARLSNSFVAQSANPDR
jgi:hypothetical protein